MDSVHVWLQQTDVEYLVDVEPKEEQGCQFNRLGGRSSQLAKYRMSRKTYNSFSAHFF